MTVNVELLYELKAEVERLKAEVSSLKYKIKELDAKPIGCDPDAHFHIADKLRTGEGC